MFGILIGASEAALIFLLGADISTAAETQIQTRRQRAVVTQRLVPLAGSAPIPVTSGNRKRS